MGIGRYYTKRHYLSSSALECLISDPIQTPRLAGHNSPVQQPAGFALAVAAGWTASCADPALKTNLIQPILTPDEKFHRLAQAPPLSRQLKFAWKSGTFPGAGVFIYLESLRGHVGTEW